MKYDYEVIEIPADPHGSLAAEWTVIQSDWMGIVDYINGECYEYNLKTGETRPIQD